MYDEKHLPARTQFSHYLRTGRILTAESFEERKSFFVGNVARRVILSKLKSFVQKRPWTTESFVAYYFIGGGGSIDLANVGLLGRFRKNSSVRGAADKFKARQVNLVIEKARNICRKARKTNVISKHGFSDRNTEVTNVTNDGPLFSVDGSTLFQSSEAKFILDCESQDIHLQARLNFRIDDRFVDAVDIFNWFGPDLDLPFSKAYNITANWYENYVWKGRS